MTERPGFQISEFARQELCRVAKDIPPGCFVEFGVFKELCRVAKGGSAYDLAALAEAQGRAIYLYDTFTGIPFKDPVLDIHKEGDFSNTSLEAVKEVIPYAICVPGIFPESLVDMPPIAFVHVDADQYQSIKAACEVFPRLMVEGGAMIFDDYNALPGATKAVDEAFGGRVEVMSHRKGLVRF